MAVQIPYDLIFHGVGTSQIVLRDGRVIDIDESQDLSIQTNASEGKQQGGDGYYDLITFITEKTAKISITDAVLKIASISAVTGTAVTSKAEEFVKGDVKLVTSGACELSKKTGIILDSVVARVADTGVILKNIGTSGTPTAEQFTVTDVGAVAVDSSLDGKDVEFSYFYTTDGESVRMLEDDVPQICEFRHTHITDPQDDGNRYKISVRAYKCKGSGSYTYEAKRGSAFSPKLEFSILNAGRKDKRVLDYSVSVYKE